MGKYNKTADIADLSISLISLVSFIVYFMFPNLVLAKEINRAKNLQFDISKAVKIAQIPAVPKAEARVSLTADTREKVNYKTSAAVVTGANDAGEKTASGRKAAAAGNNKDSTAYVPVNGDYKVVAKRQLYITGYSSTPDQTDDSPFITASNKHVRDGIVAANFLPFGAKIRIPAFYSDKIFVVEDRMNVKYNQRADIWFPTRQEALRFGMRRTEIEILAED